MSTTARRGAQAAVLAAFLGWTANATAPNQAPRWLTRLLSWRPVRAFGE